MGPWCGPAVTVTLTLTRLDWQQNLPSQRWRIRGQLAGEWSSVLKPASVVPEKIFNPTESNHVKVLKTKQYSSLLAGVSGSGASLGSQGLARGCLWLHPQEGLNRRFPALAPENPRLEEARLWFLQGVDHTVSHLQGCAVPGHRQRGS